MNRSGQNRISRREHHRMGHWALVCVVVTFLAGLTWNTAAWAQQGRFREDAQFLYLQARALWAPVELQSLGYVDMQLDGAQAAQKLRQACLLLETARELDDQYESTLRDLCLLYGSDVIGDPGRFTDSISLYSQMQPDDGGMIQRWLEFRLGKLDQLAQREYFLQQNLNLLTDYPYLASQVITQLGAFALEKGDTARADQLFLQAYNRSSFNDEALDRWLTLPHALDETLLEDLDEQARRQQVLAVEVQLRTVEALRWRSRLRNKPGDYDALVNLLNTLEQYGRYDPLKVYYDHGRAILDRLGALAGNDQEKRFVQDVRYELGFRRLLMAYQAEQWQDVLDIVVQLQQRRKDDLFVLGIQMLALQEAGLLGQAQQVKAQAQNMLTENPAATVLEKVWLLHDVLEDGDAALKVAQAAVQADAQDIAAQEALAYVLTGQEQYDQAEEILQALAETPLTSVTTLAWARIFMARDQYTDAFERMTLLAPGRTAVLAREYKTRMATLEQGLGLDQPLEAGQTAQGSTRWETIANQVFGNLDGNFDNRELGFVAEPTDYLNFNLRITGDAFSIAEPMELHMSLSNVGNATLLLGPEGVLDPHVLITAEIAQAQATGNGPVEIPICYRYLRHKHILPSNRSNQLRERIEVGPLYELLIEQPQLEYELTLRAYLDPVANGTGGWNSRLQALQPKPLTIRRRGFVPTGSRMDYYYKLARSAEADDVVRATRVLAALLREADHARAGRLAYTPRPVDEKLIRDMLAANLAHENGRVRAWSAWALAGDAAAQVGPYIGHLSKLLTDTQWLPRSMVMWTLDPLTEMDDFYTWAQAVETMPLLQRQIQFLQGQDWDIIPMPVEVPEGYGEPNGSAER